MLEDHQRAALMPNEANITWAHFVRARFVAENRNAMFAVEIVQVVPQSHVHAEVKGILEHGAGGALPVAFDFVGMLDLVSREMTIQDESGTNPAGSYAGRFSENGRVLALESTAAGRGTSKPMHLVHEGTRRDLFGA